MTTTTRCGKKNPSVTFYLVQTFQTFKPKRWWMRCCCGWTLIGQRRPFRRIAPSWWTIETPPSEWRPPTTVTICSRFFQNTPTRCSTLPSALVSFSLWLASQETLLPSSRSYATLKWVSLIIFIIFSNISRVSQERERGGERNVTRQKLIIRQDVEDCWKRSRTKGFVWAF